MTRSLGTNVSRKLVQYGFARFREDFNASNHDHRASLDEPLALLASMNYFEKTCWSLDQDFTAALSNPYAPARGIAFEYFCVYQIALAFGSPRCLSDVFTFAAEVDRDLMESKAQLVMAKKVGKGFHSYPIDIISGHGPAYLFGYTCQSIDDTLSWLRSPHTAFCFPYKDVGPDAILLLQLSDGSLLRLVLQCKHHSGSSLGAVKTTEAIASTDPSNFCSQMQEVQPPNKPNESSATNSGKRTRNAMQSSATNSGKQQAKKFVIQSHVVYVLGLRVYTF